MTTSMTESHVESATLTWLSKMGYTSIFGPDIAPEEPAASRSVCPV